MIPDGYDFTDPDVIHAGMPREELAALRAQSPVWWNRQPPGFGFDDGGFWLLTRHHDVREASLRPHSTARSPRNS